MFELFKPKLTKEVYSADSNKGPYIMQRFEYFRRYGILLDAEGNNMRMHYLLRDGVLIVYNNRDPGEGEFVVTHALRKTPDYVRYMIARAQASSSNELPKPVKRQIMSLEDAVRNAAEK